MRLSALSSVTFAAAVMAAALAGCAGGPPGEGSYTARTEKLASDCQARGGILVPSGQQTGQPSTDNACQITGATSRLNR